MKTPHLIQLFYQAANLATRGMWQTFRLVLLFAVDGLVTQHERLII